MSFLVLSTLVVVLVGVHISEARYDHKDYYVVDDHVEETCFDFEAGASAIVFYTAPSKEGVTINLMDDKGGIVLHMNYRLEQKVLVLNTKPAGGSWGAEQRVNNFYFTPGKDMEFMAMSDSVEFDIIVNGEHIATYKHRLPVDSVQQMRFYASKESGSKLLYMICGF